jgi:hypothetical protein
MTDEQRAPASRPVALVCGAPRLHRILRLALEAAGYAVRDCARLSDLPAATDLAAVVVDLDSLRPPLRASVADWRALGLPDALPALCISIYPAEPGASPRPGPSEYLQPPFPADEVGRRVQRLLDAAARLPAADQIAGPLTPA